MARFCKNCGNPVTSDEKFCHNCGIALSSVVVQNSSRKTTSDSEQQPEEPAAQEIRATDRASLQDAGRTKFCRFCGNPVREGAKFCRSCGQALTTDILHSEKQQLEKSSAKKNSEKAASRADPSSSSSSSASSVKKQQEKNPRRETGQPKKSSAQQRKQAASKAGKANSRIQATMTPQITTLTATATNGEIDLGELSISGMAQVNGTVMEVLSPVSAIFNAVGSYIGGIFSIFQKPSALIGTMILAGMWFVLVWFRGSDSGIVKALSWLTYAEGGFDRLGLGIVGGILGKGMVAAALISFFTGGYKRVFRGIGILFSGSGDKRGIINIFLGIVIGAAAYFAFVGHNNVTGKTAMVGISGVLLSLEALGGSGRLYELAVSLTSRVTNGMREVARGKCEGLLIGMTIGFTLTTIVSLFT